MQINLPAFQPIHQPSEVSNSKLEGLKRHLHSKSNPNHRHHESYNMLAIDASKKLKINPTPQQITSKNGRLIITSPREHRKQQFLRLKQPTEINQYTSQTNKRTLSIKQHLVEHENKKLVEAIKFHELDRKEFKRKLATEVSEYVKLRQHMQKFKKNFTLVLSKGHPFKLERDRSEEFQRFLTTAIEATKKKIEEHHSSKTPASY